MSFHISQGFILPVHVNTQIEATYTPPSIGVSAEFGNKLYSDVNHIMGSGTGLEFRLHLFRRQENCLYQNFPSSAV